ncbi:hypothetical protein PoB_007665800 [Plakobranchus ocellatus]|uniref:Uncharacterized protein n=1 Tax=Plakobranchus ocellatus TaxID=259542 RepID=A0AAV4E1E2_9GAST|nr:hypothetical protein PoB_007665800 [Plakobranchus ocellatus]
MAAEANLDHQIFEHLTHEKFKQAIESDDTLNDVKKLAKKGGRYFFKNGLIYRRAPNKSDDPRIVVPTNFSEITENLPRFPTAGHMRRELAADFNCHR